MKIKNISITKTDSGTYKKYDVEFNGRRDIILYSLDDWGIRFEPYDGNFSDSDFEKIKNELFDDAYYNLYFSKY